MDFNHVRPDHSCHPIEKVVEKHRESLRGCCDALDEKQARGEKSLKDVADARNVLKKTAEEARGEISKQKNDIIKAVEDIFQEKINEVDELYAAQEKRLAEQQDKVESFLDKVKCAGNMSKNVWQKGSDEEVIESHKMVKERVEMVKTEYQDIENPEKPVVIDQNWFLGQLKIEKVSKLFGTGMVFRYFQSSSVYLIDNQQTHHA